MVCFSDPRSVKLVSCETRSEMFAMEELSCWKISIKQRILDCLKILWELIKPVSVPIFSAHWHPPSVGKLKMNVDGSWSDSGAAWGGLLRDHLGQILVTWAGSSPLGISSPLHAEIMAIYEGLRILEAAQLHFFEVESDCMECIRKLGSMAIDLSPLGHVFTATRMLLHNVNYSALSFVKRSGNVPAHLLARTGYLSGNFIWWHSFSHDVTLASLADLQ